MANAAAPIADLGLTAIPRRDAGPVVRALRAAWKFTRTKPLGAAGAVILVLMVGAAVGADWVQRYDPITPTTDYLQGPSWEHWFGTDDLGRDLYARVIAGSRPSVYAGIIVVACSITIGTTIGLVSGYFGGVVDMVVQRIIDALMGFPALILTLAVVTALGNKVSYSVSWSVVAALIVVFSPGIARVVRGVTLSQRATQYVEAARVVGCGNARVLVRHILPNLAAPIIVIASVQLGAVILAESALSFLGYGTPPPQPTWGRMLSGGATRYMETAPWLAIFPGLAVSLAVLAFNLFGDALRDVLDPRLRT